MTVYEGQFSGRANHYLCLDIRLVSTQIANNRSQVSWELYIERRGGDGSWRLNADSTGNAYVDGARVGVSAFGYDTRTATKVVLGSGTRWVNHGSNGAKTVAVSANASSQGSIASASLSGSFALPTIPRTPTDLSVVQVSVSRQDLSWTRTSTYTSVLVQRRVDGGSWSQIAEVSGNAASYSDTSTSANHKYEYRVAGKAAAGTSAWSNVATTYTLPNAPSGLTVARVSDSQQSLSWTRNSTYTTVIVQRRLNGGSWSQIGTPGSNPAAYSDTATAANGKYEYRVAGTGPGGQSAWSNIVAIFTTPAAPTGLAATRVGDDIQVSATIPANATHLDIQDETTNVVTALAKSALPWTHVSPNPAVTHRYRARARVASGGTGSTTLFSGWSGYSNTVQLAAPPNAPTGLSPNGGVADVADPVRLSWVHNPVDSSAQSAYELRHRVPAGAWTTLSGTTASFRDVTLPVGVREWQVRTKGGHPDWSPWSATATVEVINRPGVAITQPDTVWPSSVLPVQWSYSQTQSRPQSAWQLELIQGNTVETRSGSGATGSVTLNTHLTEGGWTVRVRAATGGVWSDWAASNFTVVFDPPAAPFLSGGWDDARGVVGLQVAPVDDGVSDPTVRVVLERSLDGDVWEFVAEVTDDTSLEDAESRSFGDTLYRATAFTVEDATAETIITVAADSPAVWLGAGDGFVRTARLPFDPAVSISAGRQRALKQYAGRSLPVAYSGEALSRVVNVEGTILDRDPDNANVSELAAIVQDAFELLLLRDPDGNRVYGVVDRVEMPRQFGTSHPSGWEGVWRYSFALTEAEL